MIACPISFNNFICVLPYHATHDDNTYDSTTIENSFDQKSLPVSLVEFVCVEQFQVEVYKALLVLFERFVLFSLKLFFNSLSHVFRSVLVVQNGQYDTNCVVRSLLVLCPTRN